MKMMTKSLGAIAILGALAGCAGEDGTPPAATQPSPGQAASRPTSSPPAVKIDHPGGTAGDGKMEGKMEGKPAPVDGKKADDAPKIEGPSKSETTKPSGAAKLSAKELAAIKELPQAEQDVAIAQAVCPVSNHKLGGMGKPMKVTAEGRTFYLCCDTCEEDLKADPKAVVAKLDKLKAAK